MFQVRIHGRGGQGVVSAAEMLSVAAFIDGLHAQAFPSFGSERTGAPVVAFCRIDDRDIRSHEPVIRPDALIIQDPTLLHQVDVFNGLMPDGFLLINSARSLAELDVREFVSRFRADRVLALAASDIARETVGKPLPNAVLLGSFAALTRVVSLNAVTAAIRQRFSTAAAAGNVVGATRAFELVAREREAVGAHAD